MGFCGVIFSPKSSLLSSELVLIVFEIGGNSLTYHPFDAWSGSGRLYWDQKKGRKRLLNFEN